MVRKPVCGPRVAIKAVAEAPIAPKQKIVAIAWLAEVELTVQNRSELDLRKRQSKDFLCQHTDGDCSEDTVDRPIEL